jgi:L,D-transpeptidase YcbB
MHSYRLVVAALGASAVVASTLVLNSIVGPVHAEPTVAIELAVSPKVPTVAAPVAQKSTDLNSQEAKPEAAVTDTVKTAAVEPMVATAPARHSAIGSIVEAIDQRLAIEKDAGRRNWLSEMQGFYRVNGAKPLWISATGLTAAGEEAVSEMMMADTYGLDHKQFDLPESAVLADPTALADAEVRISLAAIKYAWHARGGRVDPSDLSLWLDQSPRVVYASDVLDKLANSTDASRVLRGYHPQFPEFENLRRAYLTERGDIAPASVEQMPETGPKMVIGDRHPDMAIVRRRLAVPAANPANEDLFDTPLFKAVQTYMSDNGYGRKRQFDDQVRGALNKSGTFYRPGANRAKLDKMLVNLERWRWMPERLGATRIWNNLPEYKTRVFKDDALIHEERLIIGEPSTQTPVFSDVVSHVIFQPEWGVPESIKISQLLPNLKGGDLEVLDRRNMRLIDDRGNKLNPLKIRWDRADIRKVSIVQGSGPGNPLGRLKFIFPNSHHVYMHDTPDKGLFNDTARAFSHGCMRLRNPDRYAEVLLGLDQGWTGADVKRQLGIKKTTQIDLKSAIPIHITYFTMLADKDGNVTSFNDVYSHDRRILDALKGTRSIKQIAAGDPALALKRQNKILEESAAYIQFSKPGRSVTSRGTIVYSDGSLPRGYTYSPPRPVKFANSRSFSAPSYLGFSPSGPKVVFAKPSKSKYFYNSKPSRQPSVTNPFNFGYLN